MAPFARSTGLLRWETPVAAVVVYLRLFSAHLLFDTTTVPLGSGGVEMTNPDTGLMWWLLDS